MSAPTGARAPRPYQGSLLAERRRYHRAEALAYFVQHWLGPLIGLAIYAVVLHYLLDFAREGSGW